MKCCWCMDKEALDDYQMIVFGVIHKFCSAYCLISYSGWRKNKMERYKIKTGKYGQFFYDVLHNHPLELNEVLILLNESKNSDDIIKKVEALDKRSNSLFGAIVVLQNNVGSLEGKFKEGFGIPTRDEILTHIDKVKNEIIELIK